MGFSITDTAAYAIYTALLLPAWAHLSKETMLLQQETEPWTHTRCRLQLDPEWEVVDRNFNQGRIPSPTPSFSFQRLTAVKRFESQRVSVENLMDYSPLEPGSP